LAALFHEYHGKGGPGEICETKGLPEMCRLFGRAHSGKAILTLMSFKEILKKFPPHQFLRVHKSYVVNVNCIVKVHRNKILMQDMRIPIRKSYKAGFMRNRASDKRQGNKFRHGDGVIYQSFSLACQGSPRLRSGQASRPGFPGNKKTCHQ